MIFHDFSMIFPWFSMIFPWFSGSFPGRWCHVRRGTEFHHPQWPPGLAPSGHAPGWRRCQHRGHSPWCPNVRRITSWRKQWREERRLISRIGEINILKYFWVRLIWCTFEMVIRMFDKNQIYSIIYLIANMFRLAEGYWNILRLKTTNLPAVWMGGNLCFHWHPCSKLGKNHLHRAWTMVSYPLIDFHVWVSQPMFKRNLSYPGIASTRPPSPTFGPWSATQTNLSGDIARIESLKPPNGWLWEN